MSTKDAVRLIRLLTMLLLLAVPALCCSIYFIPVTVSRDFTVRVSNEQGGVAGLKLRLVLEEKEDHPYSDTFSIVAYVETDGAGRAHFLVDRDGEYWVSPDMAPADLWGGHLAVNQDAKQNRIELTWPSLKLLRSGLARGMVEWGSMIEHPEAFRREGSVSQPGEQAKLNHTWRIENPVVFRLWHEPSHVQVGTDQLSADGHFAFEDVPDGLYLLDMSDSQSKDKKDVSWSHLFLLIDHREKRDFMSVAFITDDPCSPVNYVLDERTESKEK